MAPVLTILLVFLTPWIVYFIFSSPLMIYQCNDSGGWHIIWSKQGEVNNFLEIFLKNIITGTHGFFHIWNLNSKPPQSRHFMRTIYGIRVWKQFSHLCQKQKKVKKSAKKLDGKYYNTNKCIINNAKIKLIRYDLGDYKEVPIVSTPAV